MMAEGSKPYKTKADAKVKGTKEAMKYGQRKQSAREGYADTTSQSKFKSKAKNIPKG